MNQKIEEATAILKELGLPPAQQNERSALILLALLNLKPDDYWDKANNPLLGITPIMEFIDKHYRKKYQPNTRETIRRQTVHQFVEAGVVIKNPDQPSRPPNSPKTVYQVEKNTLKLIQAYKTGQWNEQLKLYLESIETLKERYFQAREMERIPIRVTEDTSISLSPGGQNILIQKVIDEFCSQFTPNGQLIYIGDADNKWGYFARDLLQALGVTVDTHGKMPDLVVYYDEKKWLVLVEAVTSHGPINAKRLNELKTLFQDAKVGLVFVTAFLNRKDMGKYLNEIAWETEVWVADSPSHIIHFNGERFLGPY